MVENEKDKAYLEVGYSILISMIVSLCIAYRVIKEYKADYAKKFPCRIHF